MITDFRENSLLRKQFAKKTVLKQTYVKDHDLGNLDISFPTLTPSVGGL